MNDSELTYYIRGQWETLDRILNYINTLDEELDIKSKKKFYKDISQMRPLIKEIDRNEFT
jgi:hypothetical protein